MLLGHPVTITSNLPVWDTDVHRHCDKTSVTAGSPASSDLFKVAQEKPKQNCVGWYNCQQFCKNGSPGFHKHCLGCCKASHPSQEENCTLKKDHSPHNLGSLFFSFGLLRDYSLSHMPWHHSWIGTDTPNKPESLQHPLSISITSSLLYWSCWDIPWCFPVQWNSISTPLPSAVPHVTQPRAVMQAERPACSNWGFLPLPKAAELFHILYSVRYESEIPSGKSMEIQGRKEVLLTLMA